MISPVIDTFDDACDLLTDYEQFLSGKAGGTAEAYLRTVRHLIGWIAQLPGNDGFFQPRQLTNTAVEQYLAHLEQEGFSLSHRACVKSIISNFSGFLIEEKELLRRNPTRDIRLPQVPSSAPRALSGEQRSILRKLVEREGDFRGSALFALGYWAGCRVSEVSCLQMVHTHIDPEKGWLKVGNKEGKVRNIILLNSAHKALYEYLRAAHATVRTYVFISQRSARLTEEAIHYWFRKLKAQATGNQFPLIQDLTFHDLRYDFAYRAREAGWSLEKVGRYLGLATTQGSLPSLL